MIPRRMRVYLWAVILLSAVAWVLVLPVFPVRSWPQILLLAALAFVLSSLAAELPFASSMSMGYSALFAALIYSGPVGAAVVGCVSGISVQELRERKPPILMAGNAAQISLSAMVAGVVFVIFGGVPLQSASLPTLSLGAGVVAPLASTTAFFFVNVLLITIGISLKTGMRLREVLSTLEPAAYWISLLVLALLGFVMAYLISLGSWLGLLLLILPFWMARRTFRVYVELSEAYTSTVRSLVMAIEAKDPYTRGHSERVAQYARATAIAMGIPSTDVDLLERAGLLHDVGKIGVNLDTLISPDELSEDEAKAIRRHPMLGADLLAEVSFLQDTVEIVRSHHERCDGTGYPDGMAGEDIPLLARILAVADSFDAMTSDRAYRPGMSVESAIEELVRVSGAQLDSRAVAGFVDSLQAEQVKVATA